MVDKVFLPQPDSNFSYLRVEDINEVLYIMLSRGIAYRVYKCNNGFIVFTSNIELFLKEFTKGLRVICDHFCRFVPKEDCERFREEVNIYIGEIGQILKGRMRLERAKQKAINVLKGLKEAIKKGFDR